MEHVRDSRGRERVSERRACRVQGQGRAAQRRVAHVPDDEPRLVRRAVELAAEYGRYGYRRVAAMPREDGFAVSLERLWRREGLKVPGRQPERRRLWLNDGPCVRLRPAHKGHVWGSDFVACRTGDGRPLRLPNLVDESTRGCLGIGAARRLTADDVPERLTGLSVRRGTPQYIRSDNGSEFTAGAVREWLAKVGVRTPYVEPGSPWENGYAGSSNGELRDELLNAELFGTAPEAEVLVERRRVHYNTRRPHGGPGYRPPAPEAIRPPTAGPGQGLRAPQELDKGYDSRWHHSRGQVSYDTRACLDYRRSGVAR